MARLLLVRRATAVLIGAALTVAANLPPQHGHPSRPGHPAVVHRHASLHLVGDPAHPRLCDSDGLVIWMDGSYVSGASGAPGQIDAALPEPLLRGLTIVTLVGRMGLNSDVTIHGPPRQPFGSRAPPLPASL